MKSPHVQSASEVQTNRIKVFHRFPTICSFIVLIIILIAFIIYYYRCVYGIPSLCIPHLWTMNIGGVHCHALLLFQKYEMSKGEIFSRFFSFLFFIFDFASNEIIVPFWLYFSPGPLHSATFSTRFFFLTSVLFHSAGAQKLLMEILFFVWMQSELNRFRVN